MKVNSHKDFAAGLLYLALGAAFAIGALGYRLGSPARMGPGFFPLCISALLILMGLVVLANALRSGRESDRIGHWHAKDIVIILGSVVAFGLILQTAGFVICVALLVLVSSLANFELKWPVILANTLAMPLLSYAIFVYGLSLQLPVWPAFLDR